MSDWYDLLPERPVSALGNAGLSVVMTAEIIIRHVMQHWFQRVPVEFFQDETQENSMQREASIY